MTNGSQEIRFCTTRDGVRLAYARLGAGPPVLRVGSWLTHLELDAATPVWIPWLRELSRRNTLVRYDPRGCGLSDRDVGEFTLDGWVHDLEAVADAAGLVRFTLLGTSQGGAIAIAYAVRHPERVERLVLYGSYARGALKRGGTERERDEFEALAKLIELGWGREIAAYRQLFTSLFLPDGTPEEAESFNRLQQLSASAESACRIVRAYAQIDVQALAARVRCPTLVMHADRDARVPFDEGRLVASLVPGARFVPLASRNHVMLEHEPAWRTMFDAFHAFMEPQRAASAGAFGALTPRERELLELIAEGRDNDEIAMRLGLRNKTVRNHITRIFAKLGVTTRAQAIVLARDAGMGTGAATPAGR